MKTSDRALLAERAAPEAEAAPVGASGRFAQSMNRVVYCRLKRVLSHPRADRWVILIAVIAVSTSLFCGLAADDHIHRLSLRGSPGIPGFQRTMFDLFRFADPKWNWSLMEQGVFPWWADPKTKLSFFRPLTSLSHAFDHWVLRDNAFLAHVHSVAWFVVSLIGIQKLYSSFFERSWVGTLALVFYGLDDARSGPITWLANRNALIASSLSIWALVCFHFWRTGRFKAGAWLGPIAFALSLTAAEGAIAIGGYLVAYAVYFDKDGWTARAARLLPYACIIVAWRAFSVALHYGSEGSGVYLDPMRQPIAFLSALPIRLPALLVGQIAGPWSEMWNVAAMLSPTVERLLLLLALVILIIASRLLSPLWRADKDLRFWVIGCLLSTFPSCATFPADRLLSWLAIGASAALAIVFSHLIEPLRAERAWPRWPRFAEGSALAIVVLHLMIAPLMLPWRSTGIVAIRTMLARADDSLPKTPEIQSQTFVYVNPPADPFAGYVPIMRADLGEVAPRRQRWLATGITELELSRLDDRTLRVHQAGGFLATASEMLLRGPKNPFKRGEKVALSGMLAEIERLTPDGRPLDVKIRFDVPLEDASLRWFCWDINRYKPFVLPSIGQTVVLPKVDFLKIAYGS